MLRARSRRRRRAQAARHGARKGAEVRRIPFGDAARARCRTTSATPRQIVTNATPRGRVREQARKPRDGTRQRRVLRTDSRCRRAPRSIPTRYGTRSRPISLEGGADFARSRNCSVTPTCRPPPGLHSRHPRPIEGGARHTHPSPRRRQLWTTHRRRSPISGRLQTTQSGSRSRERLILIPRPLVKFVTGSRRGRAPAGRRAVRPRELQDLRAHRRDRQVRSTAVTSSRPTPVSRIKGAIIDELRSIDSVPRLRSSPRRHDR